ncbi:probable helicase with zinc finger domain isoform X1 [Haliotis rufescens]|uniref:probable helicase with zinc finger domain isoform X1 n=1 Tax=Haliotis rufescens TaxID=6454 RepID=UPI00201EB42E|nr:probable helicase with zinc finger domain isoform X1 [Haliotis rufescens]XP_046366712.2 probable helicase with zinc finger domain isoform X1 [Haliotis rufescens]
MADSTSEADRKPTNHDTANSNDTCEHNEELGDVINNVNAFIKQRKNTEALEACNKGLHNNVNNDKLLEKKIKVLCHLGQFQEAYDLACDWKVRDPQHPVAQKEVNRLKIVLNALRDQDSEDDSASPTVQGPAQPDVRSSPDGREEGTEAVSPQTRPATNIVLTLPPMPTKNPKSEVKAVSEFVCTFCDIKFTRQDELDTHCRSDLHKKRLTSDEGHGWKFRAPPRGLSSEEYVLCLRFSEIGRCPFGDKCTQAHSEDELNEWKERFKFRKQQLQKARDSQLHGNTYTEQLMERLTNAESPKAVLVHNLDFVKVHVNSDLKVNMTNKKCTNAWTFTITSKICLHSVALLDDVNRSYFYISSISVGPKKTQKYQNLEHQCQEWINQDTANKGHGEYVYRVKVVFKTDLYGTFRQSIVFDFGLEAVMAREMQVESAPVMDTEKLTKDLILTDSSRWTDEKVEITPFEPVSNPYSGTEKSLLSKYTLPRPEKLSMSETIVQTLSKENYRLWMHEMLYLEEMAQLSFVSRFNVKTSLQLVNRFLLMPGALSTAKYAHDGQLFARMLLEDDLSEDSMGGRLILMNSQMALIAPAVTDAEGKLMKTDQVYEALIEGKGKNFIFLRLSARCIRELNLSCDQEFEAQVQFQLNRLSKCEMHSAVDKLPTLDIVFPPKSEPAIPWTPNRQWNRDMDNKLNVKQKEAIVGVVTDLNVKLPPLLIVGPFGTGKTFTMAQAAKQVLQQDDTRILICTHSNSAADLYIREFFHPYVEDNHPEARPLRVLYRQRWVQTVSDIVLDYCLWDKSVGLFRYPGLEDLEKHRIVITTLSTSRYISDLDLPSGFFTHIFIDEAAQALESETLIPLAMAGESTRIVLAGDHMQLSPEVYSDYTRQQGFHSSLLERLYELYPADSACKIMLCENYRSHSAIVDFTSELFYDNKLIASGKLTAHNSHHPLTFYAAKGEEIQHANSTGFYNNSEVYEIVERVDELVKKWPEDWGPIEESGIGVVAPYSDQVIRIRAEMRKKKMFNISVERVLNVQGKQYRVIILSTVRTRHTCRSDTSVEDLMDYGFLSNVKLLNTAITRAQSLVIVVGDPVSLCLVGKCRKVWEYYLEICNKSSSFHGMTWTSLRSQLDGAEMTKTYVLNPLAPEFVPNRLFHNTQSAADAAGQFLQGMPHNMPWQHLSPYHPMTTSYGHSVIQPMYQPPVMPYYPMPMYHPGFFSPMVYRPYIPHRQGSPVSGRSSSPKTVTTRATPMPPANHSMRGRPEHGKASPEGAKQGDHPPSHMKTFYKQPKSRMMVYLPPRMPMSYPPYYHHPMFPHHPYFYIGDEHHPHRMSLHQPPFMPQGPRFAPYGPMLPYGHPSGPQAVERGQSSGPSSGSNSNVSTPTPMEDAEMRSRSEDRSSPSVSGQKIQLMPGVKHVPAHLLNTEGKEVGSKSSTSASPPPEDRREERRSTPLSERPYSPANYGKMADNNKVEKINNRDNFTVVSNKKQARKQLKLKTGFSRQFSDDLPTPTEITDLVRMIEESIEEKKEDEEPLPKNKPGELNGQSRLSSLTKLQLNLNNGQDQSDKGAEPSSAGSQNGEKLSYAGVLRKPPLPPAPVSKNGSSMDTSPLIEPQTPRTPSGFITPGTEMEMDPFGILKSLNIESSPQHHRYPHY